VTSSADPRAVAPTGPAHHIPFEHLDRMTDGHGLFEHAAGTTPRPEHGYCVDDNARLLVVVAREPDRGVARRLGGRALEFVTGAQDPEGRFRNRMDVTGRWTDEPTTEDCWGRALWGLAVTACGHGDANVRRRARDAFDSGARQRSPFPRAMAFAALGAADVLLDDPRHTLARDLLVDATAYIGPVPAGRWAWPEPRLCYANASLAEALIAAGSALGDRIVLDRGLAMLGWLLELETVRGHLSVTGCAGRGPDEDRPQFDQQPIEVAAMADACWRAHTVTGDRRWSRGVLAAAAWFDGVNDTGAVMHDTESGGGFDGLHRVGVNTNQGAESTLAFVSTMQRANTFLSPT
jgi:hypothetical protein